MKYNRNESDYFPRPFTPHKLCLLLKREGFNPHRDQCLVSTKHRYVKIQYEVQKNQVSEKLEV